MPIIKGKVEKRGADLIANFDDQFDINKIDVTDILGSPYYTHIFDDDLNIKSYYEEPFFMGSLSVNKECKNYVYNEQTKNKNVIDKQGKIVVFSFYTSPSVIEIYPQIFLYALLIIGVFNKNNIKSVFDNKERKSKLLTIFASDELEIIFLWSLFVSLSFFIGIPLLGFSIYEISLVLCLFIYILKINIKKAFFILFCKIGILAFITIIVFYVSNKNINYLAELLYYNNIICISLMSQMLLIVYGILTMILSMLAINILPKLLERKNFKNL